MRRRVEDEPDVPPAELTGYRLWCAARGWQPYGHPLAVAQWHAYVQQRREWAAAHPDADPGLAGDMPFDASQV